MAKTRTFTVHPSDDEDGGLFFAVHICPNRRSMMRKWRQLSHRQKPPFRFGACVMPIKIEAFGHNQRREIKPFLGHVLFSPPYVNGEVVAHEAVHMATTYLRRIRKSLRLKREYDINEELLAYYTGRCAAKIANELHRIRVWK